MTCHRPPPPLPPTVCSSYRIVGLSLLWYSGIYTERMTSQHNLIIQCGLHPKPDCPVCLLVCCILLSLLCVLLISVSYSESVSPALKFLILYDPITLSKKSACQVHYYSLSLGFERILLSGFYSARRRLHIFLQTTKLWHIHTYTTFRAFSTWLKATAAVPTIRLASAAGT